MATIISIETTVNAPVSKVWEYWTAPEHITQWNHASDDWHCPSASNDVREGGTFSISMAARDGSFSFEFSGEYEVVKKYERLEYSISDGRKVKVIFIPNGQATRVLESFEAENTHSVEMQQSGWQSILNHFKRYTETH
jgi:uncharacterized protein YndB with AHSA1/START domain